MNIVICKYRDKILIANYLVKKGIKTSIKTIKYLNMIPPEHLILRLFALISMVYNKLVQILIPVCY